ncbi:MAG: hypothetical protein GXP24_13220 [Planctomycetes bacterium]|nr:hypothetical protein [Planctomycetota bacterium]
MIRITIDDEQKKKLLDAEGIVELCDTSGRLLGKILPENPSPLEGWEPITPPISEEELQRRINSKEPGITTEEFKARLRELS